MTAESDLLSPLAHLRSDPRASSTQSLVPSEPDRDAAGKPSAGRRLLLLVYVHGFYGNDQSFHSFPAHVHSFLREALADTHVIHSKIYPRYKTYRAVGVGAENFSQWLEPHEGEGTDVVLVGHSMGGILAAEVVLTVSESLPNPDPFKPHPYKHRILGLIAMDTPFLGLHPGIIPTGIASLFRKDEAPSPEEQTPALTVSTPELSVEATPTSNEDGTTPPAISPPIPTTSPPSNPQPDPLLHDPTFNPPFHNDVHLRTRTRLTSIAHFAQKHFSEGLLPAAGRHILSHMEYAACLADYRELHARYSNVRRLEDVDPLRDLREAAEREVVEGPSFRARAARVRFVNYYTAATGRPKKEKEKKEDKDKEEKNGREKGEGEGKEGEDKEGEGKEQEKEKERKESGSEKNCAGGGSTPRLSVDVREESSTASMVSYDSSKPSSLRDSTLDGSSAASITTLDTTHSTSNSEPSLPAPPPPSAPLPTSGFSKKEALHSAYGQALRFSRRKLLKQASKLLERRDPSSLPAPPPPYHDSSPPPTPPRREPPPPFTAPHDPSHSDRKKPQSTSSETTAAKMRKFCATPKKSYGVDRAWVSVPMRDIDEVDAHVSMFFADNAHYGGLVADAGRRVVAWVQEDAVRREVETAAGL